MKIIYFCFLTFTLPTLVCAEVLYGTAKNFNGDVVYLEKHTIQTDKNGLNKKIEVEYSKKDGTVFATMTSDFSKNKFVPDTVFNDQRSMTKYILKVNGDNVVFESFEGKKTKKKSYKLKDNMVASQGFDNFIKANFSKLLKKPLPLYFGVLSELDFYSLTGYPKSSSDNKAVFGIKASNFLIRLFASELTVEYDPKTKRLLTYKGRSNIANENGKSFDVMITYTYGSDKTND